jgi:triosephosphate isomerase
MTERTPIVAGNWKMNHTLEPAQELAGAVADAADEVSDVELILSPVATYLRAVGQALEGSGVGLSAQNVHWAESGAYTGEVSPTMLRDVGCSHAIIGHSERRQYFGETDVSVNRRARAAMDHDLTPMICVGESLAERQAGETELKIKLQVRAALSEVPKSDAQDMIIAYEPLWAIGTGESATPEQAQDAHATIRQLLAGLYDQELADSTRILYGGSVKPHNIDELIEQPDLDGALIGGASLQSDSFLAIARSVQEYVG